MVGFTDLYLSGEVSCSGVGLEGSVCNDETEDVCCGKILLG